MVERIIRGLEVTPHRDPRETIAAAAVEAQRPILFSMLVIIAAYIPLLTLQRVERRLFMPMALTVCYALLGSLLLALTLIPPLATFLFRCDTRLLRPRPLERLNDWYGRAIRSLAHRAAWG